MSSKVKARQDINKKATPVANSGIRGIGINKIETVVFKLKEKTQLQESRIATLEEEVQQQVDEIKALSQALEVKADEAGIEIELMYEIGKTKRENESLQDELSTKEMILNNLQEELHELRASEKLISERFSETEQALFTKAEESERLAEQVAILKAELADQNEERERLLSVIQERSAEVSVLKNKNEAITGEKQHLEVHTVGELEQTKEAYQKISNEFNLLRERYVELERAYQLNDIKLKEETKFRTYFEATANELQAENTNLNNALTTVHAQLDTFSSMNFSSQKQVTELETESSKLQDELDATRKELEEIQSRNDELAQEKRKELDDLIEQLHEKQFQIANVSKARDELAEKNTSLLNSLSEAQKQVTTLEDEKRKQEEKIESLKQSKHLMQKALMDQLNTARTRVSEIEKEMEMKKDHVEQLEKDNGRMRILLKAHKRNQDQRINDLSKKKLDLEVVDKENVAPQTPKTLVTKAEAATPLTISSTLGLHNTPLPIAQERSDTSASSLEDLNSSSSSLSSLPQETVTPEADGLVTPVTKPITKPIKTPLSLSRPLSFSQIPTKTPVIQPSTKKKPKQITTMDSAQKRFLNKLETNTSLNIFELAGVSENSISINSSALSLDEEQEQPKLPLVQQQDPMQYYGYSPQMYGQQYYGQYTDQQLAQWQQMYQQAQQQQYYDQYQQYQQQLMRPPL